MRSFLVAVLALALAPSMALAGGGSKQTGTVKVTNNGTEQLAVIANPSASIQAALASGTLDQATFTAAGGRIIGPGGVATFSNLKAGNNTIAAAYVSGTDIGAVASTPVTVQKGKTVNVSATETGTVSGGTGDVTLSVL